MPDLQLFQRIILLFITVLPVPVSTQHLPEHSAHFWAQQPRGLAVPTATAHPVSVPTATARPQHSPSVSPLSPWLQYSLSVSPQPQHSPAVSPLSPWLQHSPSVSPLSSQRGARTCPQAQPHSAWGQWGQQLPSNASTVLVQGWKDSWVFKGRLGSEYMRFIALQRPPAQAQQLCRTLRAPRHRPLPASQEPERLLALQSLRVPGSSANRLAFLPPQTHLLCSGTWKKLY